jgi:acetyl-CoA synthetase
MSDKPDGQWQGSIETILKEVRLFEPPPEFVKKSLITDRTAFEAEYREAAKDPVSYWEKIAREQVTWFKPWTQALSWNPPFAKWFIGGELNASYNCLDRHLASHGNKLALIWEGEEGTVVQWTYRRLFEEVCQLSNAMQSDLGLKAGDTAAIYLPLIPEAIVAMLACARLGVTHSVIFAGFASHAIRDRLQDAECKVIFTCETASRKGQNLDLISTVRAAVKETPTVRNVVVFRNEKGTSLEGKELDWQELVDAKPKDHKASPLDSEHPLFILYTSGTTGKPKGIVHSTGGYLTQVGRTARWIFDLKDDDVYWCTADIGWVTGHSYVVYGILSNAATAVIYEGALNFPDAGRIWKIIERHKVSVLYTAPTAIRSFMRSGDQIPAQYDLSSLRLLGTVGEPINPEAWIWYHEIIGGGRCPITDTWWQTETGAILIAPIPSTTPTKPGSATRPFPGIDADIFDESGKSCAPNEGGYLVIKKPWPSMLRGIHKDPERFEKQYWSKYSGVYLTGDGAHRDEDGYYWIKGRLDDVLNVSGHRLGTMEIESALVSHSAVAEAAVVGRQDDLKGQAVVAFVIPKDTTSLTDTKKLKEALKAHVASEIGSLARPDEIFLTKTLPKTRSGKIMRRLLKDLAEGKKSAGDTTTLENPGLVEIIE